MAADPNWTPAESLTFPPSGSQQIAVAATGDVVHLVWVAAKTLYHARRVSGAWKAPVKVAGGEQPSLAAAVDGSLCCVYANWFLGNRDIYMSTWANEKWSLSQVVSRTSGESSDPVVCIAPDGAIHVAWADTTPGYSIIYHGVRDAGGWNYEPVPNGKGSRPSITANANGVFLAWQDRLASSPTGAYEVLAATNPGAEWSLPVMVSDSRDIHSFYPRIAGNASDKCHMVWQEERDELYVIRHSDLWPNGWESPFDVSDPAADARLGCVMANPLGLFQFVWSENGVLKHRARPGEPQGDWWEPEIACPACTGLNELATAISASGELHVVFSRWINGGEPQLFYSKRKALERNKVLLPLVAK